MDNAAVHHFFEVLLYVETGVQSHYSYTCEDMSST
jgi:hypothetical protein